MPTKIEKQLAFIEELEKLKLVYRQNGLLDKSRFENSAEHSWHIALMAVVFQNEAANIDLLKVIKMLLIHDIVEIDAGDTFLYDNETSKLQMKKEDDAANRIFGLLPDEQNREFLDLWNEFENCKSDEAKYAKAMDSLQPLLNHYLTAQENFNPAGLRKSEVINKKIFIKDISIPLWELALETINKSVAKGLYIDDD